MKNRSLSKKIIVKSICLFFIIVSFTYGLCFNTSAAISFKDVKEENWYYSDLVKLCDMNVIAGFKDGTFRGKDKLTKEQYIKLLVIAINPNMKFEVDGNYWFNPYMKYAKELGIIEKLGVKSDFINNISREEISYLTNKVLEIGNVYGVNKLSDSEKRIIESNIKDNVDINEDYKEAVYTLYSKNILNGFTDNTFRPKDTLTREQAVKVLGNIISYREKLISKNYINFDKIPGYVLISEIDKDDQKDKFKTTQDTYGEDFSKEITSILD